MKINKNTTDNQDEIFIVVDKDDKIIDYRTRYECHHDKNLIHRGIGIVIFNSNGEVLIQKRSQTKDTYPGYYTLSVGGHVSKGQTYKQAAERELKEELGISVPLKTEVKFLFPSAIETEYECLFTGKSDGPFSPSPEEVESVEFIAPNKLKEIKNRLTPFAQECLHRLNLLK